jgi:hypothetical protein
MRAAGGEPRTRNPPAVVPDPQSKPSAAGESPPSQSRPIARQLVFDEVPPRADALAESLRAFGYSLPNAVADLVDNSVTAGATRVEVVGWWDGPSSWVRIRDNGGGMPEAVLIEAMRPGTQGPDVFRDPKDLGRFGLGLKTASFSQCRVVVVRSKAAHEPEATRCWDLDYVKETHLWRLLREPRDPHAEEALGHFGDAETGTVVLWQVLDRIVGPELATAERAQAAFGNRVREIAAHLGLVFHRFLSGRDAITIRVNEQEVSAWDPFVEGEPFTQRLPVEEFGSAASKVIVHPFVLPHQSKMSSPDAFLAASGPRGWNAQQGFYIYRNRRLIVSGGWLRMYHAEEHYKLARIQVDIGNGLDHEWKLDVRKALAQPPDDIRSELKRVADKTRRLAKEVYIHRGRPIARGDQHSDAVYVWQPVTRDSGLGYRINRHHPLIRALLDSTQPRERADGTLRLLEETIPIQHIIGAFDAHARDQPVPFEGPSANEVGELLLGAARLLAGKGLRGPDLRRALMLIEPFQHYPEVVDSVAARVSEETNRNGT